MFGCQASSAGSATGESRPFDVGAEVRGAVELVVAHVDDLRVDAGAVQRRAAVLAVAAGTCSSASETNSRTGICDRKPVQEASCTASAVGPTVSNSDTGHQACEREEADDDPQGLAKKVIQWNLRISQPRQIDGPAPVAGPDQRLDRLSHIPDVDIHSR